MLVKISGEKTSGDAQPMCVMESQQDARNRKGSPYVKYAVLITILCLLLAGVALGAIFVGTYINTQATKEILEYKLQFKVSDAEVKEDITSDKTDNIVVYHTNKDGEEAWVVNDFNKDISLKKFKVGNVYKCYIAPLNHSLAALPTESVKVPSQLGDSYIHEDSTFLASQTAIKDTSILSGKTKELCSGLDVYWMHKSCPGEQHTDGRIKKRADCYLTNCYIVFLSNGDTYLVCDRICIY